MTTKPQHIASLERANEVRLDRAKLKREIGANDRVLLRVLDTPPECVMTASIMELLKSQRRWGATRSRKLLYRCGGIPEGHMIKDLTTRQRQAIAAELESRRI